MPFYDNCPQYLEWQWQRTEHAISPSHSLIKAHIMSNVTRHTYRKKNAPPISYTYAQTPQYFAGNTNIWHGLILNTPISRPALRPVVDTLVEHTGCCIPQLWPMLPSKHTSVVKSQNWQEVPILCVIHGLQAAVCFLSWNMLGSNSWNFSRNALHSMAFKSDSFTKLELGGSISLALQPADWYSLW